MEVVRGNAWTELVGAPVWFLDYCTRHLSVLVAAPTKTGKRYGKIWWHDGEAYGSLMHGNRVAAGMTRNVCKLAEHYGVGYTVTDGRRKPPAASSLDSVNVRWRPYQDEVHRALLASPTGVLDATPRAGKTAMAARIIDALGQPTLYVAPSVQIVRQTFEVMQKHFGEDAVGRLDGDAMPHERDISRLIVVATAASAAKQSREWYKTRKCLIVDEVHHGGAETYHRISDLARWAYYRYGLTGTHFRTGEDGMAMEAICSDVLYRITVQDLVPEYLARPRIEFLRVTAPKVTARDFPDAYQQGIVDHSARNDLIVSTVAHLAHDQGIPTLVLTRRRAHADALGERIHGAVVVKGGENSLTSGSVKDFVAGKFDVLVGTTVIGEGVDIPRAGALVFASGGNAGVLMMQSYFRPLTAFAGKHIGYIYDFRDDTNFFLSRHSKNRADMAREFFGSDHVIY